MTVMPMFRLLRPETVAQAVAARVSYPEGRFLAGGTDLLVNLRHGIGTPPAVIDLGRVAGLRGITETADGQIRIGAMTALDALARDPRIRNGFPVLVEAALAVAGPVHRQTATVGGNLCLDTRCVYYNQSAWWRAANGHCLKYEGNTCRVVPTRSRCHAAFSGDLAPALMVLGAAVELVGPEQTRILPVTDFYRDDGMHGLTLAAGELLSAVLIPPPAHAMVSGYAKIRVRAAVDFPLAGVAAALRRNKTGLTSLAIACTGTNSRPLLLPGLEAFIGSPLDGPALDALAAQLRKAIQPLKTTVVSPRYRRQTTPAVLRRLLESLYAIPEETFYQPEGL